MNEAAISSSPVHRSTILIIDDVPTNAVLLEALVASIGDTDPVAFTDPREALGWCESNEPDLVLLDYLMPDLDGIEVLKRLKDLPHFAMVPVVVVTGAEDKDSRYRALDAGAADFLTKPVDQVELLVRSRNMLKLRGFARDLYRMATTDEMTALANRRHFMARLEEEAARTRRHSVHPLSLAILDVDFFKKVNDGYGHAAGDDVLRTIAAGARDLFRKIDTIGRLGGEEFAILMPMTKLDEAAIVCERYRQKVANQPIDIGDRTLSVTISIGISEMKEGENAASLLARADRALYRAKDAGRNQVVLATE
jgi:diguanylate cyclase (GGDEF)-like protein